MPAFYETTVRIPKERVGVLIGTKGRVKRRIEEETGARLIVDSSTGEVRIVFPERPRDPLMPMKLESVIRAIGRGFSPEKALKLLNDEYMLEIIDLRRFVGDSKNALRRVRGRLIGAGGKARTYIERRTGTDISVYGHTVSIIGRHYDVLPAKEAIIALIEGARHSTAYRRMEKKIAEMREREAMEELLALRERRSEEA
ncbi:MAG: RNA-processing protein [Thermoproteota archaeon]|nr:MAG: RNA-processing protein [Candidatus Korarchaeota archaeon]